MDLTLVKRIAEIHGGTVEVINGSPSGTEIRFAIPAESKPNVHIEELTEQKRGNL